MKLLAIDTSNWPLGVAVLEDGKVIGECNTYIAKNHSLRLMPAIEQLMKQIDLKPKELDGLAVANGPGSYTGVRIGVTTAKTMAWSLGVPLIGVSSLQVVAQNQIGFRGKIIPMFDARRGQVYRGCYQWDKELEMALPTEADQLQLIAELIQEYKESSEEILFIGEGAIHHKQELQMGLGEKAQFAREIDHAPRASQLAYVAWKKWSKGKEARVHAFMPEYLQLAEAEVNWLARQK
jgi:tRNA threonylcarbamoyladenosine biosynthesis protein TsaB